MPAILAFAFPVAQANNAAPKSMLVWVLQALGFGGLLLMLAGLLVFIGACLAVRRGRRPEVIASYAAFVPVPLILALAIALKGNVASLVVVANAQIALTPSEIAEGVAASLVGPLIAIVLMMPSYLVLAVGWLVRMMHPDSPRTESEPVAPTMSRAADKAA